MSAGPARPAWSARRIVLWSLLWALGMSAAEFFVIAPLHHLPPVSFLFWWLVIWLLPLWCVLGWALLQLAQRCEPRNAWLALVGAVVAIDLAFALVLAGHVYAFEHWWMQSEPLGWLTRSIGYTRIFQAEIGSLVAYNAWIGLFYGGLLVAAYVLMVRGERMRRLLREAALARSRTEALLGQTRLQGLQAQVDPKLLLSALDEVQVLYRREPERADALLERLVEFLRAAVPGLKKRRSTLQAELQLARAYAQLQALLPGGRRWHIEAPAELPELPFPSLLLLPLLGLPARRAAPRLAVELAGGHTRLSVQSLGREPPTALVQHTQACLQQLLGDGARLRTDESPTPRLVIELDSDPTTKELPR